jgi:hypothetical protein
VAPAPRERQRNREETIVAKKYRLWLWAGDVAYLLRWHAAYWFCFTRAVKSFQRERLGRDVRTFLGG